MNKDNNRGVISGISEENFNQDQPKHKMHRGDNL